MNIIELKDAIQEKSISGFFIFTYSNSSFLPWQYAKKIAEYRNLTIQLVEDINSLGSQSVDIFSSSEQGEFLYVLDVDKFETESTSLSSEKFLIVICNKVSDEISTNYKNSIVNFPEAEQWQIEDYVLSTVDGLEKVTAQRLASVCKADLFRLDIEMQKLLYLPKNERNVACEQMLSDGSFSDIDTFEVFSMTNAILKKDTMKVYNLYQTMLDHKIEPFSLLGLLCSGFRNVIRCQLAQNATASKVGMSEAQFRAIGYLRGYYTRSQLLEIYQTLTSIDSRVKKGEFPSDLIIDYLITRILSI